MLNMKDKNTHKESFNPEEIAHNLAKIERSNPFRVPENYFEQLPVEVLLKTGMRKKRFCGAWITKILFRPQYQLAFILAGIILILVIVVVNQNQTIEVKDEIFSNITLDDLLQESPEIIENMEDYFFFEDLVAESSSEFKVGMGESIFNDSIFTEDDLIDYLSEEEISTDLIYEL